MRVKVQFGCGLSNPSGWKNFDSTPTLFFKRIPFIIFFAKFLYRFPFAKNHHLSSILNNLIHTKALYGDIVRGLPLNDSSVHVLYASHVLEHLPLREFRLALNECKRILTNGGVMRIVVPNLSYHVHQYIESSSPSKSIEFSLNSGMGLERFPNIFSRLRGDSHHIMFDKETMLNELRNAGFINVRQSFFGDSNSHEFSEVEDLERWHSPENIGFECYK